MEKRTELKDQYEILRNNIKAIRHSMMMDKTEFANHFGFRKAFCEVETGRFNPKLEEVAKIAEHVKFSIEELMFKPIRIELLRENESIEFRL